MIAEEELVGRGERHVRGLDPASGMHIHARVAVDHHLVDLRVGQQRLERGRPAGSLSADFSLLNAPEGFLPARDVRAYTGASWLVPLCGEIQQMPRLGIESAALNVDVDEDGRIVGVSQPRPADLSWPSSAQSRRTE